MPFPTKNLQPGARGPEVSQLQQFLVEQGFLTPQQVATGPGIYGPQTKAAVAEWQNANGVDNTSGPGYWGPRSISAASGVSGGGGVGTQPENYFDATGQQVAGPIDETQESVDKMYADEVAKNPIINELVQGGSTVDEIMTALQSGDLSGIVDSQGQPFSPEAQQEAIDKAMEDNRLFYEAQQKKETADAEAQLAKEQADYQDYLISSGQSFEADKTKSDRMAADSGVLFSGSRVQREKNLARAYSQDQASAQRRIGQNIGGTARDFQYKYGTDAAKGLNKYYNLGGNTFNPNVARGGVGRTSLSNVYKPTDYDFQGTAQTERKAEAQKRAAGYLWNKGNKLLSTGYKNKY